MMHVKNITEDKTTEWEYNIMILKAYPNGVVYVWNLLKGIKYTYFE